MIDEKKHWSGGRRLHLHIGMVLSMSFCLLAFEWKSFEPMTLVDLGNVKSTIDDSTLPPITIHTTPPAPPKQPIFQPNIVETEEIEEIVDIDFGEGDEEEIPEVPVDITTDTKTEEPTEEPFVIVEQSAEPEGGLEAFYQYLSKNIKYPNQAQRVGTEGKVYVQFVIEKDGSFTDVKVIRGIGAGCDEEAVRVLSKAPNWKPAKQRGRIVRQRMIVPISFRLGN